MDPFSVRAFIQAINQSLFIHSAIHLVLLILFPMVPKKMCNLKMSFSLSLFINSILVSKCKLFLIILGWIKDAEDIDLF